MSSAEKLEWLEYFYKRAKDGMGPASGEIYKMIAEDYTNAGGYVPEGYRNDLGMDDLELEYEYDS